MTRAPHRLWPGANMELVVIVHRATGIADTQVFGKQDPYCIARLLCGACARKDAMQPPAPSSQSPPRSAAVGDAARSATTVRGGTDPAWDTQGGMLVLKMPHEVRGGITLELCLWNANDVMADERIGGCCIPVDAGARRLDPSNNTPSPSRMAAMSPRSTNWHTLDSGGRLQCTVRVREARARRSSPKPSLASDTPLAPPASALQSPPTSPAQSGPLAANGARTPPPMSSQSSRQRAARWSGSSSMPTSSESTGPNASGALPRKTSPAAVAAAVAERAASPQQSRHRKQHGIQGVSGVSARRATTAAVASTRQQRQHSDGVAAFGEAIQTQDDGSDGTSAHAIDVHARAATQTRGGTRRCDEGAGISNERNVKDYELGSATTVAQTTTAGVARRGRRRRTTSGSHRARTPGDSRRGQHRSRASRAIPSVGYVRIQVHRAMSLASSRLLGTVDPYVTGMIIRSDNTVLGETMTTGVVAGGGVNPIWCLESLAEKESRAQAQTQAGVLDEHQGCDTEGNNSAATSNIVQQSAHTDAVSQPGETPLRSSSGSTGVLHSIRNSIFGLTVAAAEDSDVASACASMPRASTLSAVASDGADAYANDEPRAAPGSNILYLKLQPGASAVRLEVWDKNIVMDELLGVAVLPLTARLARGWARGWFALNLVPNGIDGEKGARVKRNEHTAGRLECSARFERPYVEPGLVVVEPKRAEGLVNAQLLGQMDPFVSASLKTRGGDLIEQQRTLCAPSGGLCPQWQRSSARKLILRVPESATDTASAVELVRLEVWNENTLLDDRLGTVDIELPNSSFAPTPVPTAGANSTSVQTRLSAWFDLDQGGRLRCSVRHVPPGDPRYAGLLRIAERRAVQGPHSSEAAVKETKVEDVADLLGDSDSDTGGALADVRLVDAKLQYGPVPEGKINRFGVIITLLGTKPKDFTLRQLSLFLEGDELWDGLPGPVAWIIRNSFMPLQLVPDYMDACESFPAGAESFCAVIGIGTKQNGTIGVRDFKIEAAIKQLIDGGDQPFTVRLVHDDGDETSKALAEVTVPPSAYLQALQHASESETDVEASCEKNGFVVRDGKVCGF